MTTEKHKEDKSDMIEYDDAARHFHNSKREDGVNVVRTRYGWVTHKVHRLVLYKIATQAFSNVDIKIIISCSCYKEEDVTYRLYCIPICNHIFLSVNIVYTL